MSKPIELSIEQKFHIRSFNDKVQRMNREQAQKMLLYIYEQMLIQKNMYEDLIKVNWGCSDE